MVKFLLLGLLFAILEAKQLPSFITPCKRGDPNLNDCLMAEVVKIRPRLKDGIPELKIPPYDPMVIPSVHLDQGSEAVKLTADFKDLKLYGGTEARVEKMRLNLEKLVLELDIFAPIIRIECDYEIDGKVLVVPLKGAGKGSGNFTGITVNLTFHGDFVEKKGQQYIALETPLIHFKVQGGVLYFDDLLNGHDALVGTTNKFLNENWDVFMQEMEPIMAETIGSVLYQLINYIFSSYSYDELLPP